MAVFTYKCPNCEGPLKWNGGKGFDSIPEGLKLMKERPAGLIKVMIETGL